ncbi:MAG: hypothetical protein F6K47_15300 [Symploca sp. SIO2E6]|nr:hypothetical protein [Symploca sp. SIO2E6]
MNFIQTVVTIFGITATISGLGSTVYAQSPQIEQTQTSARRQKAEPTPNPSKEGNRRQKERKLGRAAFSPFLTDGLFSPCCTSFPTQQEIAPVKISQLDSTVDLDLLANTVGKFLQDDSYQTQSEMEINMTASGLSLTFLVDIDTITQSPNKFRSEITFLPSFQSSETIKYTVVGDGEEVWI